MAIWIKDETPPNDKPVLCCTQKKDGKKNIVIGYYIKGAWHCGVSGMNSNVIAWQFLPAPPEGV